MRAVLTVGIVGLVGFAGGCALHASPPAFNSAALVNPFIGTEGLNGTGNYNGGDDSPAADDPFGMIQWGPDTSPLGDSHSGGGYNYADTTLLGFSLNHVSGCPNCSARGALPFLPVVGALPADPTHFTESFSHSTEKADPGYYQLTADGVTTQLTVTERTGMAQFTFPASAEANLLLKVSGEQGQFPINSFQVLSDQEVVGFVSQGSGGYTIYFVIEFRTPFTRYGTWEGAVVGTSEAATGKGPTAHNMGGAYLTFNTTRNAVVQAKVGISFVSLTNAEQNLRTEDPGWDFSGVEMAAHNTWNKLLDQIQVSGGTASERVSFYSALYHSLLFPSVASDVNGQYVGSDGKVHAMPQGQVEYTNFSEWDMYRSEVQLLSLLVPNRVSDIVQSMLDAYVETQELPKYTSENIERYIMVGDSADPIITDAYAFGARGFNAETALTDMISQATNPNQVRPGLLYYLQLGFLPMNGSYGCCRFYGPVSTQLEYNVDDYAISELAQALGQTKTAASFAVRANNWQNVFNPGTDLLGPKDLNGAFVPFNTYGDTTYFPFTQESSAFVENDTYDYTPDEPFDIQGLADAMGGRTNLSNFLAMLTDNVAAMGPTDIQMSNEPSFEIPWEFDYLGEPSKTEEVVRAIQNQLFPDRPGGLPGNDDLGATSSWFVWSALGMYPETPGSSVLVLGNPLFSKIVVHTGSGHTITEIAGTAAGSTGALPTYVQSLTLNGKAWNDDYLPANFPLEGGTLTWTLGRFPSQTWGTTSSPPSDTEGLYPALGYPAGPLRVSVAPGESVPVPFGVQNMTGSSEQVQWSATVSGNGLVLQPASGTMTIPGRAKAVTTVTVAAADSATAGVITITLQVSGGAPVPSIVLPVMVG